MTTTNTHSLSIGEPESTQPIPDYWLNEILGGTRSVPQELAKALARQVKELRKELNITVSAHGEVRQRYSRSAEELASGMHHERDRF